MSEPSTLLYSILAYKIASIISGVAIVYLGYRLFQSGVYEKAGELKAAWGDKHLGLKSAAPGIFFSLFGAAIVAITVIRGIDVETSDRSAGVTPSHLPFSEKGTLSAELPDTIRRAMSKVAEGELLSEKEQEKLKTWLASVDRKIRIRAMLDQRDFEFKDKEIAHIRSLAEHFRRRAEDAERIAGGERITSEKGGKG